MKINHRFIYGILSIALAAIIAFIAIPAVIRKTNSTTDIVRVISPLKRGDEIKEADLELVKVGSFNLPDHVATRIQDVSGTYAATVLLPGDYILPNKVSTHPLSSDPALYSIPDGMVAISITTQTLATALADKLQANDIIRFYHYDDKSELTNSVEAIPELKYMKVLSVTDPKGLDIDYTKPPAPDEEKLQTAVITVLAAPEQAMLLTRFENEGVLHVALISRGNDELADKLLKRQSELLDQMNETNGRSEAGSNTKTKTTGTNGALAEQEE